MPLESPTDLKESALKFSIKIDGEVINDNYTLSTVYVKHQVNQVSSAELTFLDNPSSGEKELLSERLNLLPGNLIEVLAGYGDDEIMPVFAGIIVKQSLDFNIGDGMVLRLHCKHQAVKLTFNRKIAEFVSMNDSDIIQSIINAGGLSAQVEKSDYVHETLVQANTSDWDFILSRANFNGFFLTGVNGNELAITAPLFDQEPVLSLKMGESIISFSATLDASAQVPSITAQSWDIDNQEFSSTTANEPENQVLGDIQPKQLATALSQEAQAIVSGISMDSQALQVWADGTLLKIRMSALRGTVSFQGNALVSPGKLIRLEGLGSHYNGNAFVSAVTHEISEGNWISIVGFGLESPSVEQDLNFSERNSSSQSYGVSGLQVATVKKIASDPKEQFRIQVVLNTTNNQQGIWARVSNFYATADAGAGFLPEIGDEVIVGFLNSNANAPIILGSLYSSAKVPSYSPSDNNYIKSIVTRAKLKISFDDEKKVINITTPAGNEFTLDDYNKKIRLTDQHENIVMMDADGVHIMSNKDISLKAKGVINFDAVGAINLTAVTEVNTKANSIINKALVGFKASGGANTEISAAGQTIIKGSIVMIN